MWSRYAVWAWAAILAVLIGYELWCVFGKDSHTPPLTDVTIRYAPFWITMPFLTWLWLHFLCNYFNLKIPFLH